ncbi:unnamed protein product [Sphagnum balticum]
MAAIIGGFDLDLVTLIHLCECELRIQKILLRAPVSGGETIFDLPRLRICLDCVQVIIMKCMNRNARWTVGVKRVDTILQNLAQSTDL